MKEGDREKEESSAKDDYIPMLIMIVGYSLYKFISGIAKEEMRIWNAPVI